MAADRAARAELDWLDPLKGVAIVWIFLNHLAERMFGAPYIANPTYDWPPFSERLRQLEPIGTAVWYGPLFDAVRWVGWVGDDGVQLFLIASGFGLTWGLLARGEGALRAGDFYRRRLWRILPTWWGAHVLFIMLGFLLAGGLSPLDPRTWLSFFGIRFTPHLLYYFSPSWWYIGLILQLYLVYPLLWLLLRRWGPWLFLGLSIAVGLEARLAYATLPPNWLDAWLRGAVFVTRLPEFAFGMALAALMHRDPRGVESLLNSRASVSTGALLFAAGTLAALTWLGNVPSAFLLGVGAFLLLFPALRHLGDGWVRWIGRHSFAVFLVHHPVIDRFVPRGLEHSPARTVIGVVAAVVVTCALSVLLERGVAATERRIGGWWRAHGPAGTLSRLALLAGALVAIPVGGELISRALDPRELPSSGWGEREALMPDTLFGWRLKPSQTTRLRWEGYDYVVTSNALGFPGGDLPVERVPGSIRILVTGDAFSSAEGVDTPLSWPALLEAELARRRPGTLVQVANFAMTGYGPNQYAATARAFIPALKPDFVLAQFFVNDFLDVGIRDEDFRESIGFGRRPWGHPVSVLGMENLGMIWRHDVYEPLRERLLGRPRPYGAILANLRSLEVDAVRLDADQKVAARLGEMRAAADSVGATLLVLLVPASAQVCDPAELPYLPRALSLDDPRYDADGPARRLGAICDSLGLRFVDLKPVLAGGPCPYHPRNMHLTAAGHERLAAAVTEILAGMAAPRGRTP
jgi:peptidoglycan/LPS O-acetylase OafA/YrhL/lysophospholipase L1-like esterase